ncbi:ATP-binding protein [Vibrio salinus]|uniref:ATP-binding protein n=1 Tax=Vibrio salinus TaxID=2899784 RepID=UPI001E4AC625|nr:ATP-binding protein [Vibrio salinus]MCE0492892.1 ATP-binding protein [Vibrio salinus]
MLSKFKILHVFNPNFLVNRTLLLTLAAVICAQGIVMTVMYRDAKLQQVEGIQSVSSNMAGMFASTVTFFQSLPVRYRHIILDQVRNMGGTRFFVSINKEKLIVEPVPDSSLKRASVHTVKDVLKHKLNNVQSIHVDFSKPERLRLIKNDIFLSDLPKSWAYQTLTLEPLNPPVLVVQIELKPDEWIYIASLLPSPYINLNIPFINKEQLFSLIMSTILLLMLTFFLMRKQVRPLNNLARAANEMSMVDEPKLLVEEGAEEVVIATRAFNRMQLRIRRYISDREQLFSSISHDLKTPITRLRLRAELLDDDTKRTKFNHDLDDLEMMVKGALQCLRDTDLHENDAPIDLVSEIQSIADAYNIDAQRVFFYCDTEVSIIGKPLAIRRACANLIENGVKYGEHVDILLGKDEDWVYLSFADKGPGIENSKLESVFEPYYRIAKDDSGHGLGLGICRSIIHGHGGSIELSNLESGGLKVMIKLPNMS